jgi:DNA-binding NarL/FixJ family response regulator
VSECILAVDDEPQSREMHAEALRTWGYKSVVAHDGFEALLKVAEHSPDPVVSDLRMPRMSVSNCFQCSGDGRQSDNHTSRPERMLDAGHSGVGIERYLFAALARMHCLDQQGLRVVVLLFESVWVRVFWLHPSITRKVSRFRESH